MTSQSSRAELASNKKTTGLKKNIALSTIYQILALILPLSTAPYVSRVLGVENIGVYSYTHSYIQFFMLFGALGTISYGSREIAIHRNDIKKRSQLFWEISLLTILMTSFVIIAWGLWVIINKENRTYYLIWTISLLGTMFDISWFYAGIEQFKYTVTQNLLFKFLGMISIFVFVRDPDDLWLYIMILAASQTIANLSMWLYIPKFVVKVSIKTIRIRHHIKETLIYFVPTIAISIYTILDKTLIGLITHDDYENGNYEQATKIVNIAKTLSFVGINSVMQSRISYLYAQEKYDEIKDKIKISFDYMAFVSIGIVCGMIGIAERFVPFFYGAGYDKTIILLQVMAPIVFVVSISNCLGSQFYNPVGLRSKSAKFIIIGSIINLCLNLILIPRFKSEGAVVASVIAEVIISFMYIRKCEGYYSFKLLFAAMWKKVIAGLIMVFVVYFLGQQIEKAVYALIIQVMAGIGIYCALLYILNDSFIKNIAIPQIKKIIKKKC